MTQDDKISLAINRWAYRHIRFMAISKTSGTGTSLYWSHYVNMEESCTIEFPILLIEACIPREILNKNTSQGFRKGTVVTKIDPVEDSMNLYTYSSYKSAFVAHLNSRGIYKVKVKDTIFYVGSGIILDDQKKVLFYCSKDITLAALQLDGLSSYLNVYINPKVFMENTKLYKFIREVVLTNIIELKTYILNFPIERQSLFVKDINIKIEEHMDFYTIPAPEKNDSITKEAFYSILKDKEEYIIDAVVHGDYS